MKDPRATDEHHRLRPLIEKAMSNFASADRADDILPQSPFALKSTPFDPQCALTRPRVITTSRRMGTVD